MNDHSVLAGAAKDMADHTPKSYFEEKIAQKLQRTPDLSKTVNGIFEFNITGDNGGVWTVDLSKEPGSVAAGAAPTGTTAKICKVTCAAGDFMNIVTGKMAAPMAFMSGKIKVNDVSMAMKLQKVIG
jgi:putative sterol carrier protein